MAKRDEERHPVFNRTTRPEDYGSTIDRAIPVAGERFQALVERVEDGEELRVKPPFPRPGHVEAGAGRIAFGGEGGWKGGDLPPVPDAHEAERAWGASQAGAGAEPPEIPDYVDALRDEGVPTPTLPPREETLRRWVQRAVEAENRLVEREREISRLEKHAEEAERRVARLVERADLLSKRVEVLDQADVAVALGKVIRELREELTWRRRRGPIDITAARIQVLSLMVDKVAGWPFDTFMMKCEALARWAVDGPGEDESKPEDVG